MSPNMRLARDLVALPFLLVGTVALIAVMAIVVTLVALIGMARIGFENAVNFVADLLEEAWDG